MIDKTQSYSQSLYKFRLLFKMRQFCWRECFIFLYENNKRFSFFPEVTIVLLVHSLGHFSVWKKIFKLLRFYEYKRYTLIFNMKLSVSITKASYADRWNLFLYSASTGCRHSYIIMFLIIYHHWNRQRKFHTDFLSNILPTSIYY